MQKLREFLFSGVFLVCVVWSTARIIGSFAVIRSMSLLDLRMTSGELALLPHAAILAIAVLLLIETCQSNMKSVLRKIQQQLPRPVSLLAVAIAYAPDLEAPRQVVSVSSQELPAQSLLSPGLAGVALQEILRKRREQVRNMRTPSHLSVEEQQLLSTLVKAADGHEMSRLSDENISFPVEVKNLLIAVDRPSPDDQIESVIAPSSWSVIVQIFGHPRVVNRAGQVAHFDKKRALELVTWMALNRERSRRSAARTAMWDDDVADATFSTVVSSVRRGLHAIDASISATEWVPPTYSDELILNSQITTDDCLIGDALRRFRADPNAAGELLRYLAGIRDVPFAGTTYSWADLDGTTTRLVILALMASREMAVWAIEHGDADVLSLAVAAGLRVMPGDEELLSLQSSFLQTVREATVNSVA